MSQKVAMVSISEFILSGSSYVVRIFSFSFCLYVFFLVTTMLQPYRSQTSNRVNFMWTLLVIVYLTADSIIFSSENVSDESKSLLGYYLIGLYAVTFLISSFIIVKFAVDKGRLARSGIKERKSKKKGIKGTIRKSLKALKRETGDERYSLMLSVN